MRPSRRILVVSSDLGLVEKIDGALSTSENPIETLRELQGLVLSELRDVLMVIHVVGNLVQTLPGFLDGLPGNARVILVLPRANADLVVELMQRTPCVVAMLTEEAVDPASLAQMAFHVQQGDIFGLDKVLAPGTTIQEHLLADISERAGCARQVLEFAGRSNVPRRLHAHIEQCLDEMAMNALYDAPVDSHGQQVFAHVPPRQRINLTIDQTVLVQYASDGVYFGLAVRDAFGSLSRANVLRVLYKGFHATEKLDRKASGAGLGLYLMLRGVAGLYFNTIAGVATEVVCLFDLRNAHQEIDRFGFFVEHEDVTGAIETRESATVVPRPLVWARPRRRIGGYVVGVAVVVALVATAVVVPHLHSTRPTTGELVITTEPSGVAIELDGRAVGNTSADGLSVGGLSVGAIYRVLARQQGYLPARSLVRVTPGSTSVTIKLVDVSTVELHSSPEGATVLVEGVPRGQTPLQLRSLPPGRVTPVVLRRDGFEDATAKLVPPAKGTTVRADQLLTMSETHARVRLSSSPPGAQIIDLDAPPTLSRTYTPAVLFLDIGKPRHFVLAMPEHVAYVLPELVPTTSARTIEKSVQLTPAATVHIKAEDGVVTVAGTPHCRRLTVPAACSLAPGSYTIELTREKGTVRRDLQMPDQDVVVTF